MKTVERELRKLIREVAMTKGPQGRWTEGVLVMESDLDGWFKIVGYEWDDQHNDGERQTQGGELYVDFTHNGNPHRARAYVYAYTLSQADVVELITQAIASVDEEQVLDMYLGEDDIKGALGPTLGEIMVELRDAQDQYQRAADMASSSGY